MLKFGKAQYRWSESAAPPKWSGVYIWLAREAFGLNIRLFNNWEFIGRTDTLVLVKLHEFPSKYSSPAGLG